MSCVGARNGAAWRLAGVLLAALVCLGAATACGGRGTPAAETKMADGAEVGKTLRAQGWAVTVTGPPEQAKTVGTGTSTGDYSDWGDTGTQLAEGVWLIVPAELTNEENELALLPKSLITVLDDQGREYVPQPRNTHATLIWSDERWGDRDNQLVQNPQDTGQTRQGPLVFDVAEDASGLRLTMDGTDETADLGF